MSEHLTTPNDKEIAKPVAVSLYPSDVADAERIRQHFGLDSFSQVIRRVIRLTARDLDAVASRESAA